LNVQSIEAFAFSYRAAHLSEKYSTFFRLGITF